MSSPLPAPSCRPRLLAGLLLLAACGTTSPLGPLPPDAAPRVFPDTAVPDADADTGPRDATGAPADAAASDAPSADLASPQPDTTPAPADAAQGTDAPGSAPADLALMTDRSEAADTAPDAPLAEVPDPRADGPHDLSQTHANVAFPGGLFPRTVPVELLAPAAGGPWPLVVFSHGFQLAGTDYLILGRRLASHGFVVLLPTWDNALALRSHAELAQDATALLDWALGEGSPVADRLDPARVGLAGHSRGGKQSFLAALADDRIGAVFGVDPVDSAPPFGGDPAGYPSVAPERMPDLHVPVGVIGAGRGAEGVVPCAPEADNWDDYYDAANPPAHAWLIGGAGHMDFLDACGLTCLACPGGDDPAFARGYTGGALVAFFQVYLNGDPAWRPHLDGAPAREDDRVEVRSR